MKEAPYTEHPKSRVGRRPHLRATHSHRILRFSGIYITFSVLLTATVIGGVGWLADRDYERGLEGPLETALGSYAATIEGGTINSRAMGAAILFGLENRDAKETVLGRLAPGNSKVQDAIESLRTSTLAEVVLVADRKGKVVAYRSRDNAQGTGADLSFRPYIQRALHGMPNVYPGVGVINTRRGIFLSAPLRAGTSTDSQPVGAVVIKVGADKLDRLLKTWSGGDALLSSPQGIVFAASRDEWRYRTGAQQDMRKLASLRASRQFGRLFEQSAPAHLPFPLDVAQTSVDGVQYTVRSISLDWSDPSGDWQLTFLDRRPPWWTRLQVVGLAAIAGLVTALIMGWLFFIIRHAYALDVMNARLRAGDEMLKESQEIAGLGTYRLDIATGRWESSEVLNQIFGIDAAYMRTIEGWAQLLHPEDRDAMIRYLKEDVIDRREEFNREYRIITYDAGVVRWVHGLGKLEFDTQGKPVELHGTIQDITRRKRTEEEISRSLHMLEEKELAKSRFLAAAGHDLRQPLAAANLFIDALKITQPNQEQEKIILRLEKAMSTFNGLLDSLLNISRLDAGAVKPEPEPIRATEIMSWLEQNFALIAAEKRVSFKLYFPMKEKLVVYADHGLLRSVLMNLVSNAIKFTSDGGVLVSIRRRGKRALIQVWDTGPGISEEHLGHVFDEFYQINNPQRDRSRGIGLGLSIVQRAIVLLGSSIGCRSRVGSGTVFEFSLPLVHDKDEREADGPQGIDTVLEEARSDAEFARGKSFIVVEDDVLVSQGLVGWLEGAGGNVACFHDAEDALRHRHVVEAEYYIVDYMLSGKLSGIQFLNKLAETTGQRVSAVLVTGDTSPSFLHEASQLKWPVLHKPVQISQMLDALRSQS